MMPQHLRLDAANLVLLDIERHLVQVARLVDVEQSASGKPSSSNASPSVA